MLNCLPAGDDDVAVVARLEGNFPGGTADLQFDFRVVDALISRLTISPASMLTSP